MLAEASKKLALHAARVLMYRGASAVKVNEDGLDPLVRFAVARQDEVMIEKLQGFPEKRVIEKKIFHEAANIGQLMILALLVKRQKQNSENEDASRNKIDTCINEQIRTDVTKNCLRCW